MNRNTLKIALPLAAISYIAFAPPDINPLAKLSEYLATPDMADDVDISSERLEQIKAEIERQIEAHTPAPLTDLCHNSIYGVWQAGRCGILNLSDGTRIEIEENSASEHLIQHIDDLNSGKVETLFEPNVPSQNSQDLLLYHDLG